MSPNDPDPNLSEPYEPEPNALYMRWARARADQVLPRMAVSAHGLAQAYPAQTLNADSLYATGAQAALAVMFELSPEITKAVGNKITAAIMYRVGWEAMYEALADDPSRASTRGPMPESRIDAILGLVQHRLVVGGDLMLKASSGCTLSLRTISDRGADVARTALKDLPPAIGIALGDRALAVIGFYIGWAAMFAALEADLTRDPPGRQGSG